MCGPYKSHQKRHIASTFVVPLTTFYTIDRNQNQNQNMASPAFILCSFLLLSGAFVDAATQQLEPESRYLHSNLCKFSSLAWLNLLNAKKRHKKIDNKKLLYPNNSNFIQSRFGIFDKGKGILGGM